VEHLESSNNVQQMQPLMDLNRRVPVGLEYKTRSSRGRAVPTGPAAEGGTECRRTEP